MFMYFRLRSCDDITLCRRTVLHSLVRCRCLMDTLNQASSVLQRRFFFRELLRSAFLTLPSFQVHRSKDTTENKQKKAKRTAVDDTSPYHIAQ